MIYIKGSLDIQKPTTSSRAVEKERRAYSVFRSRISIERLSIAP